MASDLTSELAALAVTWRERGNGPVPTDRAIGYDECAADLEAVLQRRGVEPRKEHKLDDQGTPDSLSPSGLVGADSAAPTSPPERLSARWQELFWALPPGEMRSKLRALEIDIGQALGAAPTSTPLDAQRCRCGVSASVSHYCSSLDHAFVGAASPASALVAPRKDTTGDTR